MTLVVIVYQYWRPTVTPPRFVAKNGYSPTVQSYHHGAVVNEYIHPRTPDHSHRPDPRLSCLWHRQPGVGLFLAVRFGFQTVLTMNRPIRGQNARLYREQTRDATTLANRVVASYRTPFLSHTVDVGVHLVRIDIIRGGFLPDSLPSSASGYAAESGPFTVWRA